MNLTEWAADLINTPEITADTIREIAREFADPANQPAHIPSHKRDAAGPNYINSTKLAQAQITLNALVGTIDRRGGTLLPRNPRFPSFDNMFSVAPQVKVGTRIWKHLISPYGGVAALAAIGGLVYNYANSKKSIFKEDDL